MQLENDQLSSDQIKKRSLAGAFSYLFRSIFLQLIGVFAYFLLSALLSTEDFGVYGVVVAITSFFTIISDIGLGASIIQKKDSPTREDLRTVFTVQQILGWIVCLLIIATCAVFLHFGRLSVSGFIVSIAFALSFPIVSLKTISSLLLERELSFGKLAIPVLFENIVFYSVVVFFAWRHFGVASYAIAILARSLIGVVIMLVLRPWSMGIGFSKESFHNLMKVGIKFQLNDMLAKLKDELFTILTAFFLSKKELGYVQWSSQTARYPYRFSVESVMAVTFPTFSRLQNDQQLLKKAIEKTLFFTTLISFPLLAGFASLFPVLISFVPKYMQWSPALLSLSLFCLSTALSTVSTPLVNTLNAIGHIHTTLRLMVLWTIAQWIITPVCMYLFGFTGVALASVLISCTVFIVVYLVKKVVQFAFIPNLWRQTVAAIGMYFLLVYTQQFWAQSLSHFFLGIFMGGLLYVFAMLIMGFDKIRSELYSILR